MLYEMKKRARVVKGMSTILKDDVEDINLYIDRGELGAISEAVCIARETAQRLIDDLTEIDYFIYLHNNKKQH